MIETAQTNVEELAIDLSIEVEGSVYACCIGFSWFRDFINIESWKNPLDQVFLEVFTVCG